MQPQKGQRPQFNHEGSNFGRKLGEDQKKAVPNPQIQIQQERLDTPLVTEGENGKNGQMSPVKVENEPNISQVKLVNGQQQIQKKTKTYSYFDISPKIAKKQKIYHISNVFPVHRPYSNLSEWQNLLSKSQQLSEEELATKILCLRNRNWIQEQIKLQIDINNQTGASFESLVTNRKAIQLREHFNWLIWAVAQYYFQQKPIENRFNLPKQNTKKWTDGFEFNGIHIKVIPYDEAYYVHNEILALKYVQMELYELNHLQTPIQQQYGQIKENLHKDVILPLIAGFSCGGFYLYGSPVIYTQELDVTKSFYKESNINASKVGLIQNNSVVQNQYNSVQMQAIQNQSNMSFSYLHNNISPDFVQDSLFKFMPILKNINTKNMIPVIDFEDYNDKHDDQKADIELKYILIHLFDILPKLSETSASTLLMRFPVFINEEITFHTFPRNNCMEYRELRKLINSESELDINVDDDDQDFKYDSSNAFTKKFFTKHGWDFILMQRQGITNENKKASSFYSQREIPLKKNDQPGANNNMLLMDEYQPKDDTIVEQQQQQYVSPQKQSILKRTDSQVDQESKVNGNALISAYHSKKEFKLQYSMNNHTYSTNIESLFSASIEQVTQIIEQSDNIYNQQALKELFHRKGLNLRFEWVVLAKLRQNTQRELVMIDILLRVMRRIINEETKMKSIIHSQEDSFYQGNNLDQYKETLIFLMNTLLKKKVQKNKQVFEEILTGLFLSRMSILSIIYSLNLKKEEFFYFESKDILEDVIDAPSRNPVLFLNSVQSYFKIDFKQEVLRICRQDKHLFLSKGQPLQKTDIKQLQFRSHQFFSVREYTYFMLAKSITHAQSKSSPTHKIASKIKTKTDKDKLKQSFQRPKDSTTPSIISQISARNRGNTTGIGPVGLGSSHQESLIDNQDTKTYRNQAQQVMENKESLSTIRQYQNMDKAIINESVEFSSPPINQSKLTKLQNQKKQESTPLDFSKLSKRSSFRPTQVSEIILPSILYKLKTFLSQNPMYYFDDSSKTYIGDTLSVLRSYYEIPSLDIIDEWVIITESLLKDVYTVQGHEQVLLEALVYQAILIYFFKSEQDELFKVLAKIRDILFISAYCTPETLLVIQILTGLFFEEQKDSHPIEAEKNYLTSLICIFLVYGDPRGRGNITIPYTLFLSWKLSLLSLCEDKKIHDSEFAEEIFDASLKCLFNHKRYYKDQQLAAKLPNPQQSASAQNEIKTQRFEKEIERQELAKQLFDIRKYKTKPTLYKDGLPKSNTMLKKVQQSGQKQNEASAVYVSKNHNFNSQTTAVRKQILSVPGTHPEKKDSLKSKSQIPMLKQKSGNRKKDYDLDPSDIDLEVEDENKHFFVEENFKNNEWYIGTCPFQHWSVYRQQIAQIMQAHMNILNKNNQAQQYQKQIYKDMLQKCLPKDLFYQWLIKFNPMMFQSGTQWSNLQIKELIFSQNQQMVSSSGSSVVMSSNHNLSSHHSLSSNTPASAKEKRNLHLGSYSQILGKEAGGVSKQEMSGVLFSMGTDGYGQLGLDILSNADTYVNIKVLYPRMIVSLRDEIIKEICCGHSHTMAININGQVYAWGMNQNGQLGLGNEAPQYVRKPILNNYLSNVTKLSAGNEHSLALTKNGELYIWGGAGLTGLGDMNQYNEPTRMEFFAKTKVLQAVCGGLHTIVVTKEGETYSWGSTEGGQLGLPQQQIMALCQGQEIPVLSPQKIPGLAGLQVIQVACGEAHSIAMCKDNSLYGWGMSNYGQLGLGFSSDSFEPGIGMEKSKVHEPQEIKSLKQERIQKVICGATFSLFQTDKGDLYGCGMNDLGQLGLDTFMEELQIASLEKAKRGKHHQTSDVTLPTKVICFQGIALHNIACGENHALAVSGDDKNMLWAWGMFKNGQLGLGEVTMKMNPRPVQTLCSSSIQRISCGSMHSLALIGDSSQISTFSSQYYANNETIKNNWQCDFRGLCIRENNYLNDLGDDEVPDDGEGRVKYPL